jgi:hypothetical protein
MMCKNQLVQNDQMVLVMITHIGVFFNQKLQSIKVRILLMPTPRFGDKVGYCGDLPLRFDSIKVSDI